MRRGTHVELKDNLQWPGIIVATFTDRSGKRRAVVEHTTNGAAGRLRIYEQDELSVTREEYMRKPQIIEKEGFDIRVWRLHKKGMSNHDIADQLDKTVKQVDEALTRRKNDPPE